MKSTSREWHKSEPYLRLKNKRTWKCKKEYQTNKKSIKLTKNPNDGADPPGGSLAIFNIHCCKTSNNWRVKKLKKKIRKSQCRKNKVAVGIFQHPFCRKTKNWRGTLWGKSRKVSMPKKTRGTLVSPGMVCYAEKEEEPFWFSSLGQMSQFETIKLCRTFKNYFGQFVWIEQKSHYNSRVSLHEAPTKNWSKYIGVPITVTETTGSYNFLTIFWLIRGFKMVIFEKRTASS